MWQYHPNFGVAMVTHSRYGECQLHTQLIKKIVNRLKLQP